MGHNRLLVWFGLIVLAHWAEHILQMVQIYMGVPRHEAFGALGWIWPLLVHSEWLHFGYALVMMAGLIGLKYGFCRGGLLCWNIAVGIQVWHLIEHTLLFAQAQGGFALWGSPVPTSVVQILFPQMRAELHFFYNTLVTIPMVMAVILYYRDRTRTAAT